jgi:hypothetical protein
MFGQTGLRPVRLCARQPSKATPAKAHPTSADALYLTATLTVFAPRLTDVLPICSVVWIS